MPHPQMTLSTESDRSFEKHCKSTRPRCVPVRDGSGGAEHVFGVIKRVFGFAKVRYRGLDKNAHRLFVVSALANLFMARRTLLHAT